MSWAIFFACIPVFVIAVVNGTYWMHRITSSNYDGWDVE